MGLARVWWAAGGLTDRHAGGAWQRRHKDRRTKGEVLVHPIAKLLIGVVALLWVAWFLLGAYCVLQPRSVKQMLARLDDRILTLLGFLMAVSGFLLARGYILNLWCVIEAISLPHK